MSDKQHSPFSVQVELVEGCNLMCSFCGINGIREGVGGYKITSLGTLERVATEIQRLGWSPRIEFAMHGEPSLHPKLVDCVKCFSSRLPELSLMMTSNGVGFLGNRVKRIMALANAGLRVLGIDRYEHSDIADRVLRNLREKYPEIRVREYPSDKSASIYSKRKPGTFEVVFLQDVSTTTSGNHKLANHASQAAPPDYSKSKSRCAFPFRDLAVRWDGNVALCCDDFRGTFKVGNVNELPLDRIWDHPRLRAARRNLYHGERDFEPCHGCNAVSYRVGLLPDPTGQEELPKPKPVDLWHLRKAVDGEPFSGPVQRPWEKS